MFNVSSIFVCPRYFATTFIVAPLCLNLSQRWYNFNNTPLELFCYLTEEVGELAKEIKKTEKNMDMDISKEYESCLKHEIADVFIYLLANCNSYNIDLLEAFKGKEKINLNRDWK